MVVECDLGSGVKVIHPFLEFQQDPVFLLGGVLPLAGFFVKTGLVLPKKN